MLFEIEEKSTQKVQGHSFGGYRSDNMPIFVSPLFSLPRSFGSDFNLTINGTSDSSQHSRS